MGIQQLQWSEAAKSRACIIIAIIITCVRGASKSFYFNISSWSGYRGDLKISGVWSPPPPPPKEDPMYTKNVIISLKLLPYEYAIIFSVAGRLQMFFWVQIQNNYRRCSLRISSSLNQFPMEDPCLAVRPYASTSPPSTIKRPSYPWFWIRPRAVTIIQDGNR